MTIHDNGTVTVDARRMTTSTTLGIMRGGKLVSFRVTVAAGNVVTIPVQLQRGDRIVDVRTGKTVAQATRDVSAASQTTSSTSTSVSGPRSSSTQPVWGASDAEGPMVQTDRVGAQGSGANTRLLGEVAFGLLAAAAGGLVFYRRVRN